MVRASSSERPRSGYALAPRRTCAASAFVVKIDGHCADAPLAAISSNAQIVETRLTMTCLLATRRIRVEKSASILLHDVLRQLAQQVEILSIAVHLVGAPEMDDAGVGRDRIDLLTRPLAWILQVARDVVDRFAKAAAFRRLIGPEIHPDVSPHLRDAGQRLDVERAVMHRPRTLHLDRLMSLGGDLPADSGLRAGDDLPCQRGIPHEQRIGGGLCGVP